MIFNDYEFEIMKKYRFSRVLDEEDEFIVDRFRNIGLMNVGYTDNLTSKKLRENPDADTEIKDTAVLTNSGRGFYHYECIRRSPIRRFLHGIIHSV